MDGRRTPRMQQRNKTGERAMGSSRITRMVTVHKRKSPLQVRRHTGGIPGSAPASKPGQSTMGIKNYSNNMEVDTQNLDGKKRNIPQQHNH